MNRKKYKIKYNNIIITLISLCLILVTIYLIICSLLNKFNKKTIKSNYSAIITNSSELNSDIVKEYFVDGMNVVDYKNTIEKIDNYLKVSETYNQIIYDFEKEYHYSDLEKIYNNLAKSDIVKLEIIGTTVDGRNMYSIEIGTGDKVTMFEASIHAAESANTLFITKFMIDLVNEYENNNQDIIEFLKNNKIVILPCANPDGYEITRFGVEYLNNKNLYIGNAINEQLKFIKFNANGVDLNRNFPSQTAGLYYKKYDLHESVSLSLSLASYSYYPGQTLGSEPEVKAIIYWQNKWINVLKSYVALHSAGQSIYNGKPFLSDEYNKNSYNCASIIGDITNYRVLTKEDEEAGEGNDGTSSEYMAESLSGFIFSSGTGRLSSDYYAKKYDQLKYNNTCVIVIESLENYTNNLTEIKNEYYDHNLEAAYKAIVER